LRLYPKRLAMMLTPLEREVVLHFGETGSRWGINRTVGQLRAPLFLSATPPNAGGNTARQHLRQPLSIAISDRCSEAVEADTWTP
jgi:hypothetical protein